MLKTKEQLNELSGIIVDAAMEVHREFGPGLLERVYEAALAKVPALLPIHEAQLLTYLRLTRKSIGLLINFNVILLRDGIKRRVLNFPN